MAPFDVNTILGTVGAGFLSLGIGILFGFVLESAGFGNSRKLAAQFYFYDQTVIKVMFSAIVVAMLLLSIFAGLGLLDMSKVWVNPTYLWPAIIGGFLLGVGFIIGGYCPGTSIVSTATLKIDGMFFVLGVMAGIWVFGEVVYKFTIFWHNAGYMSTFTIPEMLGVKPEYVVFGVAIMAIFVFWGVETLEKMAREEKIPEGYPIKPVKARVAFTVFLILIAIGGLAIGQPTKSDKVMFNKAEIDEKIATREYHIHPGELLDLIYNNRIQFNMFDLRDEVDYNQFHLLDSRHVTFDCLNADWITSLPDESVKVVMSNDESEAEKAWGCMISNGVKNVYILEGGINGWLNVFGDEGMTKLSPPFKNEQMHYKFDMAYGGTHPASRPPKKLVESMEFEKKVKVIKAVPNLEGGCG